MRSLAAVIAVAGIACAGGFQSECSRLQPQLRSHPIHSGPPARLHSAVGRRKSSALRGLGSSGVSEETAKPAYGDAVRALVACFCFSVVTSSFYVWSVLLPALEASLGVRRAPLSAVFSAALVCSTLGTSGAVPLFARLSISGVVLAVGATCAGGLALASAAVAGGGPRAALAALAIGYAGLFGAGSGAAYALNCKITASPLFAGWNGLATGLTVAGRSLGAPAVTPLVRRALHGGSGGALRALALWVGGFTLPVALLLRRVGWEALAAPGGGGSGGGKARGGAGAGDGVCVGDGDACELAPSSRRPLLAMWCVFLAGSLPGQLAHGHAAAILSSRAAAPARRAALTSLGVSVFAGGSLAGRLAGGALIDRVEVRAGAVGTSGGEAACFQRAEGLAPRDLTGSRALAGA